LAELAARLLGEGLEGVGRAGVAEAEGVDFGGAVFACGHDLVDEIIGEADLAGGHDNLGGILGECFLKSGLDAALAEAVDVSEGISAGGGVLLGGICDGIGRPGDGFVSFPEDDLELDILAEGVNGVEGGELEVIVSLDSSGASIEEIDDAGS